MVWTSYSPCEPIGLAQLRSDTVKRIPQMIENQSDQLGSVAEQVGGLLKDQGSRLTTVESCTGGWIAQSVTAVAGSSVWFERGFITYSNEAKHELVGVPGLLIIENGAVSGPVARAMARGGLDHSPADIAVAVTGVAGPDGGSIEKPVGTVFVSWALRSGALRTERFLFEGDRVAVRAQTVIEALGGLIRFMHDESD